MIRLMIRLMIWWSEIWWSDFIYNALPWLYLILGLYTLNVSEHPLSFVSGCLFTAAGALVLKWRRAYVRS